MSIASQIGHRATNAVGARLDPYAAIEGVVTWDSFTRRVDEAERLAQPESFDHLNLLTAGYGQVRRYAPTLLETFDFRAARVAAPLMAAIETATITRPGRIVGDASKPEVKRLLPKNRASLC